MGFKCTKYVLCRMIDARAADLFVCTHCGPYARDADLFVYGHSFLHFYMSDNIKGREL